MLTVGLLMLTQGLALVVWGSEPYELPPFSGERPIGLLGVRVPSQGLWIAGTRVVVIVALWYLLARTAWARRCAPAPTILWRRG